MHPKAYPKTSLALNDADMSRYRSTVGILLRLADLAQSGVFHDHHE